MGSVVRIGTAIEATKLFFQHMEATDTSKNTGFVPTLNWAHSKVKQDTGTKHTYLKYYLRGGDSSYANILDFDAYYEIQANGGDPNRSPPSVESEE